MKHGVAGIVVVMVFAGSVAATPTVNVTMGVDDPVLAVGQRTTVRVFAQVINYGSPTDGLFSYDINVKFSVRGIVTLDPNTIFQLDAESPLSPGSTDANGLSQTYGTYFFTQSFGIGSPKELVCFAVDAAAIGGVSVAATPDTLTGADFTLQESNTLSVGYAGASQSITVARAGDRWKGPGGGSYNNASNWVSNSVPNALGAVADMDGNITSPSTVTVDSNVIVGTINLSSPYRYTITGAAAIALKNSTGNAKLNVQDGNHTISAGLSILSNTDVSTGPRMLTLSGPLNNSAGRMLTKTGDGTLIISGPQTHGPGAVLAVSGGAVNLNSDAGDPNRLNLTVAVSGSGSAVRFGATQHMAGLNLSAGGGAQLTWGGSKVLVTRDLSIDANSCLDLTDNDLIVDYQPGDSPLSLVTAWITAGFAEGAWTGKGITSAATGDPNYGGLAGIGFADNAAGLTGEFSGQTVDDSAVLVKFTWYGDADLNGAVNTDDFALWVAGFSGDPGTSQTWLYGDFDYNGAVNTDDFALWAYAFDGQTGVLGEGLGSPVPEPGVSSLLVLGGLGVVLRRRAFAQVTSRLRCSFAE